MTNKVYRSLGQMVKEGNFEKLLETLKESMPKLPKDQKIIVYCRGRLCANSNIATQILNRNGFDAVSLNSSYYYWNKITE